METIVERPSSTRGAAPRPFGVLPLPAAWCIVVAGAFLVGGLSSFVQGVEGIGSLGNSAGPWWVCAVLLLLLVRPRLSWGMPLGVVLLLLTHVGYTVTTNLRGYSDFLAITNPWVLLAFPAGLLAGACAVALRGIGASVAARDRIRGGAIGVGAAILAGEGIRGLLTVADTTGGGFWIAEIVAGVVVAAIGLSVARTPVGRVVTLGVGVVGTAGVIGAYLLVGGA